MYTGQVSGLFCGYPFALILLQTVHSDGHHLLFETRFGAMVLVRFAYGFLDRLVPCSLYRLCPFAPPPLQGLLHYYGLLSHGFMSHFLLMRLVC